MPNALFIFFAAIVCWLNLPATSAHANTSTPQRIASLNLCTDQLLLMLAPRSRIASVTDWAARADSSYMATAARGITTNHGSVESVLPQNPDLIIASEYTDPILLQALQRLGYRVATLSVPQNLAQARAYILQFGELIGESAAAQHMIDDMDRRLRVIDTQVANSSSMPLAAVYAPNGMTVGQGAVLAEIIERAGWRNLGNELSIRGYAQISLEQLIAAQPQLLVLDITTANRGDSIAHGYLAHPALSMLKQHARTVIVPPPLSECVGPNTIDAIELLMTQHESFTMQHASGAVQ